LRARYSASVLREIERLLLTHLHAVPPSSLLGEALLYLHGQWPKLTRFVDNGAWPLDSNPVENAIRPFVVGRKGWLFADTVGGANASANLYSLIETAKANGIEPYHYLVALFKKLPLAETADDYEALLPWRLTQ
jgi:transposase